MGGDKLEQVGDDGIGPSTSSLSVKRSTTELVARRILNIICGA